ncbi:hypothetical protein [Flindersiella endophytica]
MRGNGLEASSYVAIADLDPRVADNMLEILREAGVAAYAEPCLPQQGLLLEVTLPPAPLDRLHVDREEALRARQMLRELLAASGESGSAPGTGSVSTGSGETAKPERPTAEAGAGDDPDPELEARVDTAGAAGPAGDRTPEDDDLIWAQIVEAYERESKDPVNPWPAVEDTDDDGDSEGSDDSGGGTARGRDSSDSAAGSTEAETEAADSETATTVEQERYVPPPPPPLPKLDPITKLCWGVTLSGPVLMLLAAFAGGYVPAWFLPLGVVAFVGGFVALVFRMRGGPPDESDDGAVV